MKSYAVFASYERVDEFDSYFKMQEIKEEFIQQCAKVCPNKTTLCDIVLDVCYKKSSSKRFAWEMCGPEIIQNLLARSGGAIRFPTKDEDGEITYCGKRFSMVELQIGEENEPDFE